MLLKISLPPPYGDMAAVAPVSQLMLTGKSPIDLRKIISFIVNFSGLPLWLILGLWKIYQKCFLAKKTSNQEIENHEKTEVTNKSDSHIEKKELLSRLAALPDSEV